MASYQNFLFSTSPKNIIFEKLIEILRIFCSESKKQGSLMTDSKMARIEFGREEHYFYFSLIDEPFVVEESLEIFGQHKDHKKAGLLKNCLYRIEFYGDDDPNMDYFNDYFYLMELIQKNTNMIIYDYINKSFSDEV